MKYRVLFIGLLAFPFLSYASIVPVMGDARAESHQLCGETIDVEIRTIDNNTTLIGLINNQTHDLDLFISEEHFPEEIKYSKFTPVKYDSLSGHFVVQDDQDLDIMWGSSIDKNKQLSFILTLGTNIYTCSSVQKWPIEKANLLYGKKDNASS